MGASSLTDCSCNGAAWDCFCCCACFLLGRSKFRMPSMALIFFPTADALDFGWLLLLMMLIGGGGELPPRVIGTSIGASADCARCRRLLLRLLRLLLYLKDCCFDNPLSFNSDVELGADKGILNEEDGESCCCDCCCCRWRRSFKSSNRRLISCARLSSQGRFPFPIAAAAAGAAGRLGEICW